MSNWFQDHPSTSVITYTLLIAGSTWAASTFILQDNRINLAKSELEAQKALAEQYKAKSELLQKDIETLRSENQEYKAWLSQSKDAIPIMVPRLLEMKKQIIQLTTSTADTGGSSQQAEKQPIQPQTNITQKPAKLGINFGIPQTATIGSAGIDETTGTIVTVKNTTPDRNARIVLTFPDQAKPFEDIAYAGKQYKFTWGGHTITLTITDIQFYGDKVTFKLKSKDH